MKKQLTTFLGCMVGLLSVAPTDALAQQTAATLTDADPLPAMVQLKNSLKAGNDARSIIIPARNVGEGLPGTLNGVFKGSAETRKSPVQMVAKLGDGTELWGNIVYAGGWNDNFDELGIYSFQAVPNGEPSLISGHQTAMDANGGGVFYDGKYHCVNYLDFSSYGYFFITYSEFNTSDWSRTCSKDLKDFATIAVSVTHDPVSGNNYGCFYNSKMNGYQIGTIEYNDTAIAHALAPTTTVYLAMAASAQGKVYAIDTDGNLYQMTKSTGAMNYIGKTGVTPGRYMQSATIDPYTGKMYWAAVLKSGASALYEVDVFTGKAQKIFDFNNYQRVVGLYVPGKTAEAGAPALVDNLKATFPNGGNSGTVTFKAPTETFDGKALSGSLTYQVLVNGDVEAEGTTTAGADVSADLRIANGEKTISVVTKNSVGTSPKATVKVWVGLDEPKAPDNVKLTADGKKATVTWDAVTEGEHNGFIGNVTYEVKRYPDNVVLDTVSATTFTETFTEDALKSYYYGVTALNNTDVRGTEGTTHMAVVGAPKEVPYSETFDNQAVMDEFTVLDVNNDYDSQMKTHAWVWADKSVHCASAFTVDNDDWLLTPPIHLQAGKSYKLSFSMYAYSEKWTEQYNVSFGEGDDPATYKEIVPVTQTNSTDKTPKEYIISVDKDGSYKIGFHYCSPMNRNRIDLDNINIVEGPSLTAPDSVNNIVVTPASKGRLQATIAFNAPVKNINGDSIQTVTKIEVYNQSKSLVASLDNVKAGERKSVTDFAPANGYNKYTVVGYTGENRGLENSDSAYVGLDAPAPARATGLLVDQQTSLKMSWKAPLGNVGIHGGWFDPNDVIYGTWNVNASTGRATLVQDSINGFTADVPYANMDAGSNKVVFLGVTARNSAGESDLASEAISKPIVVGKPYTLPYKESFPALKVSTYWWVYADEGSNSVFSLQSVISQDNDAGCIAWAPTKPNEGANVCSSKISLKGTSAPKMIYYYLGAQGKDMKYDVIVSKSGATDQVVKTVDCSKITTAGWQRDVVDLSAYKDERYVVVKFHAYSPDTTAVIAFDNVVVREVPETDIEANLTAQNSKVKAGSDVALTLNVKNNGLTDAKNFSIKLYANDKLCKQLTGSVNAFEDDDFNMSYQTNVSTPENVTLKAVVTAESDANMANDTSAVNINVVAPSVAAPENAAAKLADNGIDLTWTAPTVDGQKPYTDSFEDYEPWKTSGFGDWTTIDGDGAKTYGLGKWSAMPNAKTPYAFMVINPSAAGFDFAASYFKIYDGNQMLISLGPDQSVNKVQADDWLISPKLSGKAQTLTFYARSINNYSSMRDKIQILYSKSTIDRDSFTVAYNVAQVPSSWRVYKVEIPDSVKYFAIHDNSNAKNGIALDDFTFIKALATVTGYRIYRDGVKIADVAADKLAFTDVNAAEGTHVYNITALYGSEESGFSNDATIVVTGIDDVNAYETLNKNVEVYTIDGVRVAAGNDALSTIGKGVYIVKDVATGKTVTVVKK